MTPAVSVLVPYLNSLPFIERALVSLARQTFKDFEVLLVNNGSTDGSSSVAEKFVRSDSRFRSLDCRGSLVDALEHGLAAARGRWVARFDSDDICHRDRLALQLMTAAASGERTVVSCMVRSFPVSRVTPGYRTYENWINSVMEPGDFRDQMFVESPVPHPTAFFSRREIIRQGGYRDVGVPEDYELWLRLFTSGFSFARVPRVLLGWRERPDRLSRIAPEYSMTSFYRLKAMYLEKLPCLKLGRVFIAGCGQCARRLSGALVRRGIHVEGFISPEDHPHRQSLRGRPVRGIGSWKPVEGIPVLVASRETGASRAMVSYLKGIGLRSMKDYVQCS